MKKSIVFVLLLMLILPMSACKKESDISKVPNNTAVIKAYYPSYDSPQEIVDVADLIFSGTVENVSYSALEVSELPYTLYEIKVINLYKGNAKENTITIKCLGGILDDTKYVLEDDPQITEGETYLFLTEIYENSYPTLLNLSQAIHNMKDAEGNAADDGEITLSQILEILE